MSPASAQASRIMEFQRNVLAKVRQSAAPQGTQPLYEGHGMSTVRLFASPQSYAEVERQRDEFQLQAAQYRLLLDEVQKWLDDGPVYVLKDGQPFCILPEGWDNMRKKVDEVLK